MKHYLIESAEALPDNHSIRVRWNDGLVGTIDLSDLLAEGVFRELQDPARFRDVRLYEYGHALYWMSQEGFEIDICPDVLRAKVDPEVADWIAEQERLHAARQAAE